MDDTIRSVDKWAGIHTAEFVEKITADKPCKDFKKMNKELAAGRRQAPDRTASTKLASVAAFVLQCAFSCVSLSDGVSQHWLVGPDVRGPVSPTGRGLPAGPGRSGDRGG